MMWVDSDGDTALHMAAQGGHTEIVELLLALLDPDSEEVHRAHLSKGPSETASGDCQEGGEGRVVPGVNATGFKGSTALARAAAGGHAGVIRLLLGAGGDPNIAAHDGDLPLHMAAQAGHLESMRLFLDAGSKVPFFHRRALSRQTELVLTVPAGCDRVQKLDADHAGLRVWQRRRSQGMSFT